MFTPLHLHQPLHITLARDNQSDTTIRYILPSITAYQPSHPQRANRYTYTRYITTSHCAHPLHATTLTITYRQRYKPLHFTRYVPQLTHG